MKSLVLLLLLSVLGLVMSTQTLSGELVFTPSSEKVIGNALSSTQQGACTQAIQASSGTAQTPTYSVWQASAVGGVQTTFSIAGISDDDAAAVRLGSSMDPTKLQTDVDAEIAAYYSGGCGGNCGGESALGATKEIATEPSAANIAAGKVATGFIEGTITLGCAASTVDLTSTIGDSTHLANLKSCLAEKLVGATGSKLRQLEITTTDTSASIKARSDGSSGSQFEYKYKMTALSVPQEEGYRSHMATPEFPSSLTNRISACTTVDNLIFLTAKVLSITMVATTSGLLYIPPRYEVSSDTKNLNGIDRLSGSNVFPTNLSGDDFMTYFIGVGIIAASCLICALCSWTFIPCCYCCVGPVKKREKLETTFNRYFISAIFFMGMITIGWIVGLSGEAKLADGMRAFKKSFVTTAQILLDTKNMITDLGSSVESMKTQLRPSKDAGCDLTTSLYTTVDAFAIKNPIPDSTRKSVTDLTAAFDTLESNRQLGSGLFLAIGPFLGLIIFLYCLKIQLRSEKCNKPMKVAMCFVVPCSFFYFFFLWFLAFFFTFMGVLFADFCAVDPLNRFKSFSLNDMMYFFTCTGTVSTISTTMYNMGSELRETQANMDGLQSFLEAGGGSCSSLPISDLKGSLGKLADVGDSAANLMRCKSFNTVLTSAFYDGVCYNVTSGFAYLVLSFGFMASFTLCLLCVYRKYRKTHGQVDVDQDFDSAEYGEGGKDADGKPGAQGDGTNAEDDPLYVINGSPDK